MSRTRLDEADEVQTGGKDRCWPEHGLVACRGDAGASKRHKLGLVT
ncbi:hypothetical protein [Streptomyces capillispiralis]|nr:hypothetical protein [Streptomyces capillispiralis]